MRSDICMSELHFKPNPFSWYTVYIATEQIQKKRMIFKAIILGFSLGIGVEGEME